jgi:hypothetical protein
MVELGAGHSRCGARILITRLAVMATALLIVVLASSFPQTTSRATVPAQGARALSLRFAGEVTKPAVAGVRVRRVAAKATAVPQQRARTTPSPVSPTASPVPPPSPSTTTSPMPAVTEPTAAPTPSPTTTATTPTMSSEVAAQVREVEEAGIDPGPNWSWSMGNPSTSCGTIPDASIATGCTSGAAGAATTVFSGIPTLALVAHELANAETENDAVPSLMAEVDTAEAGTSWSPIDAVASCLVAHFMGFQDNAAGSWQCPADLASTVAADIHETAGASAAGPTN